MPFTFRVVLSRHYLLFVTRHGAENGLANGPKQSATYDDLRHLPTFAKGTVPRVGCLEVG